MKHSQIRVARSKCLLCITICLLTLIIQASKADFVSAASTCTIRVLKNAEIKKDKIILGEIADIRGEDSDFVREIEDIFVGKAPLPGKSRKIYENYIKIRLKQHDVDLSRLRLEVPTGAEVFRTSIVIPKEKIEKVVLEFLFGKIPWEKNRVKIKEIQISDNVILPEGTVTYRIVPPKNIDFLGTIPLSILFKVNGSFERKVWATIKLEVLTEVVVTKRPLKRYQMINDEDVILKRMDLRKVNSNSVTSIDEVLGKRSKRAIKSNVVLTTNHIELPPLVKRGDVVVIIAESDGLRITALGEVGSRGCRGERIRVVNLDSRKAIYARVMDSNTVKVDF